MHGFGAPAKKSPSMSQVPIENREHLTSGEFESTLSLNVQACHQVLPDHAHISPTPLAQGCPKIERCRVAHREMHFPG